MHVRWLGEVDYAQTWAVQQAIFASRFDHLLLCTHPPVFTLGVRAKQQHLLTDPETLGASALRVNRGGDITFHGPGQLVGYPILTVAGKRGGGMADTVGYVHGLEQLLIDTVAGFGVMADRIRGLPGIWVDAATDSPRKLAAIGVRLSRGRSMHGFALNIDTDLDWYRHIVPCGIDDKGVTSLANEGVDVTLAEVVEALVDRLPQATLTTTHGPGVPTSKGPNTASRQPGPPVPGATMRICRQDVAWKVARHDQAAFTRAADRSAVADDEVAPRLAGRLAQVGVTSETAVNIRERKPSWMRVKLETGDEYRRMKRLSSELNLATVCEEAGCPNIYECWNESTATFMLLGERCTRACGFCLVDTQKPLTPDRDEPRKIAEAVAELGLDYAVLTMVARDDLADGGARHVATTVAAIGDRSPQTRVELLISDLAGSEDNLKVVTAVRPDVINHNIETVARLQRAVRPSAGYVKSLSVLARARAENIITKSGIIVGMGETVDEVKMTMADLAAVGVSIVTIGQYLRPTSRHLPVDRWWDPDEFAQLKVYGEQELGIAHVEASPLTRSSHHAASAFESAAPK